MPRGSPAVKGLAASGTNLALAVSLGVAWPPVPTVLGALVVGWLADGLSLSLSLVVALRQLGTARTGAYSSTAPFLAPRSPFRCSANPSTDGWLSPERSCRWGFGYTGYEAGHRVLPEPVPA